MMMKVLLLVVVSLCIMLSSATRNCSIDLTGLPDDTCSFDLQMRNAQPKKADEYFCTGYKVSDDILGQPGNSEAEGYIVKYEALADAGVAHHILVFGCKGLRHNVGDIWHCGQVCEEDHIIFAWAKNAPPLVLPKNVGQHIGHGTGINYIVIQIHYARPLPSPDVSGIRLYTTQKRQPYIAGIYLLLGYGVTIPANTDKFHIDAACRFNWGESIVPFGFRTHAHSLGRVISGYSVKDGGSTYQLIGKGNPQWPQAFYPVEEQVPVNPGDTLAARCTYDSSERNRQTEIGETANDEMCNFYIMYYMNASMETQRKQDTCANVHMQSAIWNLPSDADTPLPPNPALEDIATGHHHHTMNSGNIDKNTDNNDNSATPPSPSPTSFMESPTTGYPVFNSDNLASKFSDSARTNHNLLNSRRKPQGRPSTSYNNNNGVFGTNYLGRDSYDDYDITGRSPYVVDYPGYDDYYDVIRGRNRNRVKSKPVYDLYDAGSTLGLSEFPAQSAYPALSRNRNKQFNDKYDEYAGGKGSVLNVSAKKGGRPGGVGIQNGGSGRGAGKIEAHTSHMQSPSTHTSGQGSAVLYKAVVDVSPPVLEPCFPFLLAASPSLWLFPSFLL